VSFVTLAAGVANADADPAVAAAFGADGKTELAGCLPPPVDVGLPPCVTNLSNSNINISLEYRLDSPGIAYVAVVNTPAGSAGLATFGTPEPGSMGLMGLALVAAALVRRVRSAPRTQHL
jgi:hypothetical protein